MSDPYWADEFFRELPELVWDALVRAYGDEVEIAIYERFRELERFLAAEHVHMLNIAHIRLGMFGSQARYLLANDNLLVEIEQRELSESIPGSGSSGGKRL